jgi:hypothetical protein
VPTAHVIDRSTRVCRRQIDGEASVLELCQSLEMEVCTSVQRCKFKKIPAYAIHVLWLGEDATSRMQN